MINNLLETPVTNRGVDTPTLNEKFLENKGQTDLLEHRGGYMILKAKLTH